MDIPCVGNQCPNWLAPYEALTGYTAADQCLVHASFWGCVQTLLNAAPFVGKGIGALVDIFRAADATDSVFTYADAAFEAQASGVWKLGPGNRGFKLEDIYADNFSSAGDKLPPGFKTFDFYNKETGAATSLKSVDLTSKTYQDANRLSKRLSGFVNSAAHFTNYTRSGYLLDSSRIASRSVVVVIPAAQVSMDQVDALYNAYEYGVSKGVSVQFLEVAGS
jgi:filamentous hemagglutinin